MSKNVKRKELKHSDPSSELEVMKDKIRELEATVKAKDAKEKELMSKIEEFQMFKNNQVGLETDETDETQGNEVVDILLVFMDNNGLKGIAYKIFSFLDGDSLFQCRKVCRSWKNFIDNEWSMLQLQIVQLRRQPGLIRDDDGKPFSQYADGIWDELDFGPLFKIMEKTRNKPELRVFIKMCQEWVSLSRLSHRNLDFEYLYHRWYEHTVDHHRHEILKLLLDCRFSFECFTHIFRIACQYGCEICVKLILERSEEELNQINNDRDELQRCFFAVLGNKGFKKEVMDLLLRCAEEKGMDIPRRRQRQRQRFLLRWRRLFIADFSRRGYEIEEYSDETYRILKIDPSVDLERSE